MTDLDHLCRDEPVPEVLSSPTAKPFNRETTRAFFIAESGQYEEAAVTLERLLENEPDLPAPIIEQQRERIVFLRKLQVSGFSDVAEYRKYTFEIGETEFVFRLRSVTNLWDLKNLPSPAKYQLLAEIMEKAQNQFGQLLVLEAIPELPDASREDILAALMQLANFARHVPGNPMAESAWRRVRKEFPGTDSWPIAVYNLGVTAKEQGHRKEAIKLFKELIDSRPNDRAPGSNLMEAYRNYSHYSALQLSDCYELEQDFRSALKYAVAARDKYTLQSWCGVEIDDSVDSLAKRIARLQAQSR